MLVVGVTGGICSGKTTVSSFFKELGAYVINVDNITKTLLSLNSPVYKKIVSYFTEKILDKNKKINKNLLSEIIFTDEDKREILNKITHPQIINKLIKKIDKIQSYNDNKRIIIVVDIPLAQEVGLVSLFDRLVVVKCREDIQVARIQLLNKKKRRKISAQKLIAAQIPISRKTKLADFVIINNKDLEDLKRKTLQVYKKIINNINKK